MASLRHLFCLLLGAAPDILARIVDNKPGAGGNTGTDLVAKAAPDGQTFFLTARELPLWRPVIERAGLRPSD